MSAFTVKENLMDQKKKNNLRRIASWMKKGPYDALLLSGVKEETITRYIHGRRVGIIETEEIIGFVKTLVEPSKELLSLWSLHDEEYWAKLYRISRLGTSFPECYLLNKGKKELKKLWNTRPRFGGVRRG